MVSNTISLPRQALMFAADDVSVYDVLEKGLNDLMELCDVVTEKFTVARDAYTKDS